MGTSILHPVMPKVIGLSYWPWAYAMTKCLNRVIFFGFHSVVCLALTDSSHGDFLSGTTMWMPKPVGGEAEIYSYPGHAGALMDSKAETYNEVSTEGIPGGNTTAEMNVTAGMRREMVTETLETMLTNYDKRIRPGYGSEYNYMYNQFSIS